jgi:intracellular sulfur oxidation DsrE/DsrF family protein
MDTTSRINRIELEKMLDKLSLEMEDLNDAKIAMEVCRRSVKLHQSTIRNLKARINRVIPSTANQVGEKPKVSI